MVICIFSCETTTVQHVFSQIFAFSACHICWGWYWSGQKWVHLCEAKLQKTRGDLHRLSRQTGVNFGAVWKRHPAKPQIVVVLLNEGGRSPKLLPKNMDYDWIAWWSTHGWLCEASAATAGPIHPEFSGVCLAHRGEGSNLVQTCLACSAALMRTAELLWCRGEEPRGKTYQKKCDGREKPQKIYCYESLTWKWGCNRKSKWVESIWKQFALSSRNPMSVAQATCSRMKREKVVALQALDWQSVSYWQQSINSRVAVWITST